MTSPIDPWSIPVRPLSPPSGSEPQSGGEPAASRAQGPAALGEPSNPSASNPGAPAQSGGAMAARAVRHGGDSPRQYTSAPPLQSVRSGAAELRPWHAGPWVAALQQSLNLAGQDLSVDGLYGPRTRRAVATIQQAHGLPVTGRVDARTWTAVQARAQAPEAAPTRTPDRKTRQPVVPIEAFEPAVDGAESPDLVTSPVATETRDRLAVRLIDEGGLKPHDAYGLAAGAEWVEHDGKAGLQLRGRWHPEAGFRPVNTPRR